MIDLLKNRLFSGLIKARSYPLAAQVITLVGFGLLIAGGLAAPHVPAKMTGVLRNTNLASLIVWSLWWPLVIISAVLLGRVWCQVCPMELVNSFFSRLGLKRKAPGLLVSGWGTAVFYSFVLLGFIRTFWAHRYPERMAAFFLFLFASAVIAGLVFEKRTFCNLLCPVGRILGLYACCAPLEWRVREAKTCEGCRTKDCVAVRNAYRLTSRGCASDLYPASIADNRACLVCTQCRKVCPADNLRWSLRRPMADFFAGLRLRDVELFLLLLISGLVVWELAEEWTPARAVLEFIPAQANARLGLSGEAANLVQALFLFVLLPVLLFLAPAWMGRRLNRTSLLESARSFGLVFLPVVALGHLVKAAFRIVSRLPYYSLAFADPEGTSTAGRIASGELEVNSRLADLLAPGMTGIALAAFAGALISVWWIGLKSPAARSFGRSGRIAHLVIATAYGAALTLITILSRG